MIRTSAAGPLPAPRNGRQPARSPGKPTEGNLVMTASLNANDLMGRTAVDSAGDKIGKIGQVYLDDQSGQPSWITVSTGLFGTKESFAPLQGATSRGDDLVLAVTKDQVKDAPNVDDDGHLDEPEQAAIWEYYAGILGSAVGSRTVDTEQTGKDHVLIPPNSFALCETVEVVEMPRDALAICVGKSTYARCGIIVNVTPIEPEWRGKITLEISNTTPLPAKIYANEGIAQLIFLKGERVCAVSYADKRGKYQDQPGLTLPRVD